MAPERHAAKKARNYYWAAGVISVFYLVSFLMALCTHELDLGRWWMLFLSAFIASVVLLVVLSIKASKNPFSTLVLQNTPRKLRRSIEIATCIVISVIFFVVTLRIVFLNESLKQPFYQDTVFWFSGKKGELNRVIRADVVVFSGLLVAAVHTLGALMIAFAMHLAAFGLTAEKSKQNKTLR